MILITGGIKSGKSRFAIHLAKQNKGITVFIATCISKDKEMEKRVKLHKKSRPKNWITIENNLELEKIIKSLSHKKIKTIIIDCLTLYISALIYKKEKDENIINNIKNICKIASTMKKTVIVVTNEVGCGTINTTKIGRRFTDMLGKANQIAADYSSKVFMMVSGIPVLIKGGRRYGKNK